MSQRSPLQGLDAFEAADHERFFGRDQQVTELYQRVRTAKLTLLYGLSGTGKSSLVRCGLANRFGAREWLPVFIRRGRNIHQSITEALYTTWRAVANPELLQGNLGATAGAEQGDKSSLSPAEIIAALQEGQPLDFAQAATQVAFPTKGEFRAIPTLEEQVARVYNDLYRPIYLIFDQFEELYTINPFQRANQETYDAAAREQWDNERQHFYDTIRNLLDAERVATRIILIMREEWWGRMNAFEKRVPELNKNRMLVERMGEAEVAEVIRRTAAFSQQYNDFRAIILGDLEEKRQPEDSEAAV
ncbi:MAG: ATP-binding protein, partial [Bacteroidota bacterium]